jgi:hypothetical protein
MTIAFDMLPSCAAFQFMPQVVAILKSQFVTSRWNCGSLSDAAGNFLN